MTLQAEYIMFRTLLHEDLYMYFKKHEKMAKDIVVVDDCTIEIWD